MFALGDLYGAIGSPVRLSRTVVVGRRQELVQRLLYVLTYFIRCSELLETHLLESAEDEAIVMPGSLITTSLRRGEVEESDYVLVTVHKPSQDYLSQGAEAEGGYPSDDRSTYTDGEAPDEHKRPVVPEGDAPVCREAESPRLETRVETVVKIGSTSPCERRTSLEVSGDVRPEVEVGGVPIRILHSSSVPLEKKPPDKSSTLTTFHHNENEPSAKVTFLIGDSMSPESDMESRQLKVEEEIKKHKKLLKDIQQKQSSGEAKLKVDQIKTNDSKNGVFVKWSPRVQGDCTDMFDEYFSDDNPVETRTIDDVFPTPAQIGTKGAPNLQGYQVRVHGLTSALSDKDGCGCKAGDVSTGCCKTCCSAEQDKGIEISLCVPSQGTAGDKTKALPLNDWEIPRNESSDSALGDSESEDAGQELPRQESDGTLYGDDQADWQDELEVPLPG